MLVVVLVVVVLVVVGVVVVGLHLVPSVYLMWFLMLLLVVQVVVLLVILVVVVASVVLVGPFPVLLVLMLARKISVVKRYHTRSADDTFLDEVPPEARGVLFLCTGHIG